MDHDYAPNFSKHEIKTSSRLRKMRVYIDHRIFLVYKKPYHRKFMKKGFQFLHVKLVIRGTNEFKSSHARNHLWSDFILSSDDMSSYPLFQGNPKPNPTCQLFVVLHVPFYLLAITNLSLTPFSNAWYRLHYTSLWFHLILIKLRHLTLNYCKTYIYDMRTCMRFCLSKRSRRCG